MSEIYRHSINKAVTLGINATGAVTARVGRTTATLASTTVTTVDAPDYKAAKVPYSISRLDGDFFVEWTYTVESVAYTMLQKHTVVTPLVDFAVVRVDQATYDDLEPLVRHFIEGHCRQFFGLIEGSEVVRGYGWDYLQLPMRLETFDSITFNATEYEPAAFEVRDDGWVLTRQNLEGLTIKEAPPEPSGVIMAPNYQSWRFNKGWEYTVTGQWGYERVPEEVSQAANLLLDDWSCLDAKYRAKYLENYRTADWRIQFKSQAFHGTGNLTADALLEEYQREQMVLI
jgi:hypothetical protein